MSVSASYVLHIIDIYTCFSSLRRKRPYVRNTVRYDDKLNLDIFYSTRLRLTPAELKDLQESVFAERRRNHQGLVIDRQGVRDRT